MSVAAAQPAAAQPTPDRELRLSFNADGTVNLVARDVTVRDILAEWARQCQCHVVNAERLPGGALATPLQFEAASQHAVLQSLLRSAAGYVLTPRQPGMTGASQYGTIFILATSSPLAGPYVPPAAPMVNLPTLGSPNDELAPVMTIPTAPPGQPAASAPASSRSSPFSRSSSPFVSAPNTPTPAPMPGAVTPIPQIPGTMAPATGQPPPVITPPRPGTVVPIVPITPSNP